MRHRMIATALALVGLLISLYLWLWKIGWLGALACGEVGCETVQLSEYADVYGVPVAFVGMVGYAAMLVAGLIERQVRRVLARLQQPIKGLMPEGRDTLRPTVKRLFKAFADYSLVLVKDKQGRTVASRFARLNEVQEQILKVLELPEPAEIFAQAALA